MRCCCGRVGRNTASCCSSSGVNARSGVRSSMIQMPRPWVASTRSPSRGCTIRSRTATAGKSPPLNCAHVAPSSGEIHRPNSVPAYSSPASHRILAQHVRVALDALGLRRIRQRLPVRTVVGGLVEHRRHVAEGVPVEGDVRRAGVEPARIDVRHPRVRRNARAAVTFFHDLPPSRVTWTLPSSVPTQMTSWSFGDSLIA